MDENGVVQKFRERNPDGVELYMRVGDNDELLIGVAKTVDHVPELLRAVAGHWSTRAADGRIRHQSYDEPDEDD